MELQTDPRMNVELSVVDGEPHYTITLSRLNFNHICAGCPDLDKLSGHAPNGTYFYIFENPHGEISDSFKPLPGGDGYFITVGAPVPIIPFGVTGDNLLELAEQASQNLEQAINGSGRIPIEVEMPSRTLTLGYVVMNVERNDV